MTAIQVQFPTDVFAALRKSPAEVAEEIQLAAAVVWYARGLISQGKAAEIAGLSRAALIDLLAASGVSPCQETLEEINTLTGSRPMADKERTTSAVEILHRRYVKDDPERKASVELERLNARVAQLIYDLRNEANLTQKELAQRPRVRRVRPPAADFLQNQPKSANNCRKLRFMSKIVPNRHPRRNPEPGVDKAPAQAYRWG